MWGGGGAELTVDDSVDVCCIKRLRALGRVPIGGSSWRSLQWPGLSGLKALSKFRMGSEKLFSKYHPHTCPRTKVCPLVTVAYPLGLLLHAFPPVVVLAILFEKP